MLVNKTFYRINHSKKNNHPSPIKQQNQKKQETKKPKSILKLPSVKNWSGLQFKIYHLGQLIGQGAFSKVYQALRKTDECKCVVKIIQKDKLNSQERKKAFKRQLQVLNLPKHKNLVNSIDQFQTPEIYGIVMQYFSSESVGQYIKNNRPIQNHLLQSLTKQICQGLMFLHGHGISHRDIKPQNLLINQQGEVKIIDFGFATTSQLTEVVIAGTPQYMAPELIARKNYDPLKADIWALGIMLYWMALGYFPQDADQKRKKFMANKIQGFNLRFPININPGLQYLIRKMLHPDPKQRIQLKDILQDTWIKPKLFKDQIKRLRQSKNHSVSLSVPL